MTRLLDDKFFKIFSSFTHVFSQYSKVFIRLVAIFFIFRVLNWTSSDMPLKWGGSIETFAALGESSVLLVLIPFSIFLILATIHRFNQVQYVEREFKKIQSELNHLVGIKIEFHHVNGKSMINADKLLDELLSRESETAASLYWKVKGLYKDLQEVEIMPEFEAVKLNEPQKPLIY